MKPAVVPRTRRTAVKLALGALMIAGGSACRVSIRSKPIRLVQWDSNPNPRRSAAYRWIADAFAERNPGVEIDVVPVGIAGFAAKLLAAHESGRPPDIADMWPSWQARLLAAGALHDLEPALAEWPRRDDLHPANLRLSRAVGGRARFLAVDLFLPGTHYRADLVAAAGLPDPRLLDRAGRWDGAAFLRTARALHRPAAGVVGVALRGGQGAELTLFNLMMAGNRGKWSDETGRCLLDTPAAVAALAWYAGLATEWRLTQATAAADGYQEFMGLFYRGGAGLTLHGDDGVNALHELGRGRYGTARMPLPAGAERSVGLAGFGPAVMARSPHSELAARYVCFFAEHYAAAYLETAARFSGERIVIGAPLRSDLTRPEANDPLYDPFFREALADEPGHFLPPYALPDYERLVRDEVQAGFGAILRGTLAPSAAAKRWAAAFTRAQRGAGA